MEKKLMEKKEGSLSGPPRQRGLMAAARRLGLPAV
jgi:hypothetical protein